MTLPKHISDIARLGEALMKLHEDLIKNKSRSDEWKQGYYNISLQVIRWCTDQLKNYNDEKAAKDQAVADIKAQVFFIVKPAPITKKDN